MVGMSLLALRAGFFCAVPLQSPRGTQTRLMAFVNAFGAISTTVQQVSTTEPTPTQLCLTLCPHRRLLVSPVQAQFGRVEDPWVHLGQALSVDSN